MQDKVYYKQNDNNDFKTIFRGPSRFGGILLADAATFVVLQCNTIAKRNDNLSSFR